MMATVIAPAGLWPVRAPTPVPWPGGEAHAADHDDALGHDVSGLVHAVDGSSSLWAVRDPGELMRLDLDGDRYDLAPGWGDGRRITWPDGNGRPDAEAVTAAADRSDVVYVAAERDIDDPDRSRLSVLEVPVEPSSGKQIVATRSWELTDRLPAADANTGIEGLAWIPDDALVAAGFVDDDGERYSPADHPGHGAGLFVTGAEADGRLDAWVLGDDGDVVRIATFASGLPAVMDLAWQADAGRLWAACDEHCDGLMAQLTIGADGRFAITALVSPPDALGGRNDEGFTIGGCDGLTASAVWADDAAPGDHVLRRAALPCGTGAPTTTTTTVATDPADDGDGGVWTSVGALGIGAVGVGAASLVRRRLRPTRATRRSRHRGSR